MARPDPKQRVGLYNDAKTIRGPWEHDWRMASAYVLPRHYAAWGSEGGYRNQTPDAARRLSFDSTGARALPKFVAILQRILTPQTQKWHAITTNPHLMKNQRVKMFCSDLTDLLFRMRYNPYSHFPQTVSEIYASLGVYGTASQYLWWRKGVRGVMPPGFGYKAVPMMDMFLIIDDEGGVSGGFRRMFLNARQFLMRFPGVVPPKSIRAELSKERPDETAMFEIVHYCIRKPEGGKQKSLGPDRYPYEAGYIAIKDEEYVGDESGYLSMCFQTPRIFTEPGDHYGFSPAMQALPALGGLSAMKKTLLKQGQKTVDPTLLAADDGVISGRVDNKPGHVVFGGMSSEGRPRVAPLQLGRFDVAIELVQDERKDVEDAFLVVLFQILTERPEITATEQIELLAEKASLVAPMMGRLQSEHLGPTISREIDLLAEHGMLPPLPPELIEADGEYEITYTSPLSQGMHAEEIGGFIRSVELAINIGAQTQEGPGQYLDHFDFDQAIPAIAERLSTRPDWINPPEVVEEKRAARQEQAETTEIVQQAPAIASVANQMMKQEGRPKGTQ